MYDSNFEEEKRNKFLSFSSVIRFARRREERRDLEGVSDYPTSLRFSLMLRKNRHRTRPSVWWLNFFLKFEFPIICHLCPLITDDFYKYSQFTQSSRVESSHFCLFVYFTSCGKLRGLAWSVLITIIKHQSNNVDVVFLFNLIIHESKIRITTTWWPAVH